MAFHFFTGENSINNIQLNSMAYGPLSDLSDFERYNLENKFSVNPNSPAFAISKSILIALEDSNDSNLLNFALLPIESNYTAGFPIKFFIYRGILKSSIISPENNILSEDQTWDSKNILNVIQELQTKINEDNGTNDVANSNSLGLQFNILPNDTILESLFFDELDDFHPIIVPLGCQIGKFKGGDTKAGIELIFDKIGYEAQLSLLKAPNHILQISKLIIDNELPEKEKTRLKFINRLEKEEILNYMDITAFYGACKNQNIRVKGVPNNTNYLSSFLNNKVIYLDIRDERGYSYNHFFNSSDIIEIGFYDSNGDVIYTEVNYYQDWPIINLQNQTYNSSKEYFYIRIPILIGMPEHANIITSFTKKVSFGKSKRSLRSRLLNQQNREGDLDLKSSEPIRLKNWDYNDNDLGVNYFLLKMDRIKPNDKSKVLAPVFNSFFSLKMKNIFGTENIEDGEFRVKTYSSINAPLLVNGFAEEIYYPTIGIAVDKYHITFFSYHTESVNGVFKKRNQTLKVIDSGKYKLNFDVSELNYENENQAVGFLYQILQNYQVGDFELTQYQFNDIDNNLQDVKLMKYLRKGESNFQDNFFDNFDTITITHQEYNHLKSLESLVLADPNFINDHPLYIKSKNNKLYNYQKFCFLETTISLGIAEIIGDDSTNIYEANLSEYPNNILVDGEEIIITSILTKQ